MKYLSELTGGIVITGTNISKEIPILGLAQHSKKVLPGYIFFVSSEEAEKYIGEAIERGASLVCGENEYVGIPFLKVKNVRMAVAVMSRAFYNYPDKKLSIVGVVGTNGKTTVTKILGDIFSYCGCRTAVIGTLGVFIGSERYKTERTTPDSPEYFYYLSKAVENNVQYVFCEISAHAIYFEKLYGIRCDLCVFTNFSQDHLDFFKTMEEYKNVKTAYLSKDFSLFDMLFSFF